MEQEIIVINKQKKNLTLRSLLTSHIPPKLDIYFKNIFVILSIIMAIHLYQSGLKKCPYNTEIQCSKDFLVPRLSKLIRNDLISIFIYGVIFLLYREQKIKGIFIWIILIILIFQLFISSHEMDKVYFKLLYQLIYATLLGITIILALTVWIIIKLFRKLKLKFIIGISIFGVLCYTYVNYQLMRSCDQWKLGLMNKSVSSSADSCEIVNPKYCWYDYLDGYQDLSKFYNNCQANHYNKQKYLEKVKYHKSIPDSTKYIAYPRTEKFDESYQYLSGSDYQTYFLSQIKALSNKYEIPFDNELYLDLDSFEFHMNIQRNKTLIQERKKLANKLKNKQRPKNIITVWVDAVSRPRFMKKLHKSTAKLKKMSEENERILYQGFKYTALAGFTQPILQAYEYGLVNINSQQNHSEIWSNNLKNQTINGKYKSLSKLLKEQGYIIGKARAQCNSQIQEMNQELFNTLEPSFSDHEMVGVSCDIMSQSLHATNSITKGPYSILRRCVNEKDQHQYVFDYAKQFLQTYSDEEKYLEVYLLDGHEGTGEVLNYLDNPMEDFFNYIQTNNHDEESIIILLSDHGQHMQGLTYLLGLDIFEIERALPGIFILADKSLLNESDLNNLYMNEQKAIMIMDLHYFLKFLVNQGSDDEQFYRENSLISPTLPISRSCEDMPMPSTNYCPCISK